MPSSVVCVDAGVALRLVLPEPGQDVVLARWADWIETGTRLVSPYLFAFETTSVVRNKVARGLLARDAGETALAEIQAQRIELVHPEGLESAAWQLATALDRPTAYDAFYLAVGRLLDGETWTTDERLYRAAHRRAPWLRLIAG